MAYLKGNTDYRGIPDVLTYLAIEFDQIANVTTITEKRILKTGNSCSATNRNGNTVREVERAALAGGFVRCNQREYDGYACTRNIKWGSKWSRDHIEDADLI